MTLLLSKNEKKLEMTKNSKVSSDIFEMVILKFLSLKFETLENSISGIANALEVDEIFLEKPLENLMLAEFIETVDETLKITSKGEEYFLERIRTSN